MEHRWQALLSPWADVRADLGALYVTHENEGDSITDAQGVLWYQWQPASTLERCRRQLQLLRLMALLVHADRAAFHAMFVENGGPVADYFLSYRAKYERDYRFGIQVSTSDVAWLNRIRSALASWREADTDTQFTAVRRCLLDSIGVDEVEEVIPFSLVPVVWETMEPAVVAAIESLQRLKEEDPTSPWSVLSIKLMTAESVEAYGARLMTILRELLDGGAWMGRLRFSAGEMATTPYASLVHLLHSALFGRRSSNHEDDAERSVIMLDVIHPSIAMPIDTMIALMTAIAQSHSVRLVDIYARPEPATANRDTLHRFWRWLAVALFSRHAQHRVEKISIECELLIGAASPMAEIVHRHDPLLHLIDPSAVTSPPPQGTVVDIPPGTTVQLVSSTSTVVETCQLPTAWTALRVLGVHAASNNVSFVLPGWGHCRAGLDTVTLRHCDANGDSSATRIRGVPRVRLLYLSEDTTAAALDFLEVIGPHVTRLDLHEPEADISIDSFLMAAFERCPNLQTLDLYACALVSLDSLVESYAQATCAITRLKLRRVNVAEGASVHRFFKTLADPATPLARHLRQLSFHIFNQVVAPGDVPYLASCAAMLATNWTLRECRALTWSATRQAEFASTFERHDGQSLKTRKAPLVLASKLAFLSAIASRSDGERTILARMDSDVVGLIFQFAAQTDSRVAIVEIPCQNTM